MANGQNSIKLVLIIRYSYFTLLQLIACITLVVSPSFTQYSMDAADIVEEGDVYTDAPTRKSNIDRQSGQFEGIFVEKKGTPEDQQINILFLFSNEPYYGTTFFDYYDTTEQAVILDFYDFHLGASIIDSLSEAPIQGTHIEQLQVDLNKGVQGMRPDIREVVRIRFFSEYNFPYKMEIDEFNMLTMSYRWNEEIKKKSQLGEGGRKLYWMVLLSALIISSGAYGTFLYLKQ